MKFLKPFKIFESRFTSSDLEYVIKKANRENDTAFEVRGAYGFTELWCNGRRLESGSPKECYNTFLMYKYSDKCKKIHKPINNAEDFFN